MVQDTETGKESIRLLDTIIQDLVEPEFYANFAKLEAIELMQGAKINEKPHYEKQEQFICLIEGTMSTILVPHVFRQEVMGGKMDNKYFHDYDTQEEAELNNDKTTSPVNFFNPNMKKYPFWKDVQKLRVDMSAGDCIFVPAYHYYQFQAENLSKAQRMKEVDQRMFKNHFDMTDLIKLEENEEKQFYMAQVVSFKYEGNSELLNGIYDAIEQGVIN